MAGPITVTMARVFQTTQPVRAITTALSPRLRGYAAAALALPLTLGLSSNAIAGKWTITPNISVTGTYTDNASLVGPPTGGDFIMQVAPGIHIDGRGGRFTGNLDYRANGILYSTNSSENRIANTLSARGTLEVIENFFYLEAFGNIGETFISPFAPRPGDVLSITDNRVESRTYGISPYVRGQVGNAFSYQVGYRDTWTDTNSGALANVRTSEWTGRAASPIRLFGWALDYNENNIVYGNYGANKQYSKLYRGTLYFQPDFTLRLNAGGGWEENNYSLETRSNNIYGGGISWKPTPLTSADFQYEHRYFGPSRVASLRHRTRLTAWTLAYSKNATTSQQALLTLPPGNVAALLDAIFTGSIPDPVARQAAVARFFQVTGVPAFLSSPVSFYTQQVFLQERVEASVALLGKRSSVILNAFRLKSQALTSNFNSAVPDAFSLTRGSAITQHGFGISANRSIASSTSLGAGATRTYSRQDIPATVNSRNDSLTLSLNKTLSPKTTTFAGFNYSRFTSEGAASSTGQARSVFAGLNHRF
jgi:uncharacterized protein (PEP-CTERM system associated)